MAEETYPHKILIVEDDAAMSRALSDNLLATGFGRVLHADNGEEGLAVALREAPDLILLDIVTPKMDGMTMLRKLREDSKGKDAKVILLTNLTANDSIMKELVANEPSYYFVKSNISINEVMEKVKIALGIESLPI
jgi:DNA-binding response OmpR family regulator